MLKMGERGLWLGDRRARRVEVQAVCRSCVGSFQAFAEGGICLTGTALFFSRFVPPLPDRGMRWSVVDNTTHCSNLTTPSPHDLAEEAFFGGLCRPGQIRNSWPSRRTRWTVGTRHVTHLADGSRGVEVSNLKAFFISMVGFCMGACGPPQSTVSAPIQSPEPMTCDFGVFTFMPAAGYIETGVVEVTPGDWLDVNNYVGSLKKEIEPAVCRAGGDAAVGIANGHGIWLRAIILKRTEPRPTDLKREASGGCENDLQCKGDRICVKRACVSP